MTVHNFRSWQILLKNPKLEGTIALVAALSAGHCGQGAVALGSCSDLRHGNKLSELSEVLGGGGEQKLGPCTVGTG